MGFGTFSNALSDFSETLRRIFRDPLTHSLDPAHWAPQSNAAPPLATASITPPYPLDAPTVGLIPPFSITITPVPTRFEGRLEAEDGWARWAGKTGTSRMPTFATGGTQQVGIPPLPRRATCHRQPTGAFQASSRCIQEAFSPPPVRGGSPELGAVVARRALDLALGLPIAFAGQDIQKLPKPLWMRYSLQLVKATGENIRNLDVLGIYRIPSKGVAAMQHDPKSGHLFLRLTPEAARAARLPFLLARRKDDRSLVSCFLEEG